MEALQLFVLNEIVVGAVVVVVESTEVNDELQNWDVLLQFPIVESTGVKVSDKLQN